MDLNYEWRARSQGGASGCSAPTRNLQNIKDKHAGQPAEKRATPHGIHVLPVLYRCGWKRPMFRPVPKIAKSDC